MSDEMELDGSSTKRACDSCRTRKIRCDRSTPCSNCRASKLSCTTTAPAQKAIRQRVHISEEYEKKIDRIEDRLSGIENVLAKLASRLSDLDLHNDSTEPSSRSRPSRKGSRVGSGKSPTLRTEASNSVPFEGETAINSQSGYARELLTKIVGNTPSIGQNEEIKSALSALGDIVTRQGHVTVPTTSTTNSLINRALSDVDPGKLDRPPWLAVKEMLDRALKYPTMAFAVIFPFLKMRNLYEIFEDAYQDPAQCEAPRRILAFGVGYNLFTEFSALPWCTGKHHLEVAITQLDVFIPASYENVMALILGAACAIEMCKPSLAWVLTAMAAGMSQNLGYHRYQTFQNDEEEERNSKVHLFWMIYMFDKQLSLRLGRASVIQDWDMSLPLITSTPSPAAMALGASQMMAYWIKIAKVQGQTYEKLFSPAAFLRSPEDRLSTAVDLINAMNQAWYERGEASVMDFTPLNTGEDKSKRRKIAMASPNDTEVPSKRKRFVQQPFGTSLPPDEYIQGSFERVEDVFFHADVVMHYSTCALISRAVSSDNVTFSQECLEYSRAALVAHERCNAQFNTGGNEELWSGYIHWSILQAPFTPFIVVFCNSIQKSDSLDLSTLQNFVASLESCRTISEGADKLYKMCHLFLQVAKLYIQAKKNDSRSQPQTVSQPFTDTFYTPEDGSQLDLSTMTQFDPYLSALGLVPNSTWPMADYADSPALPTAMTSFANVQPVASTQAEALSLGYAPNGVLQNPIQDWFSGSRYLMNLMEAGDDMQMPDLNDFDVQL
ncbi:fungal specific transcription factor domain-containing protein [Stagonosporopsis vannaccii]|nr:fungal specific transcription factor domain-containing protein [Stagonosporopsis vannaccii]